MYKSMSSVGTILATQSFILCKVCLALVLISLMPEPLSAQQATKSRQSSARSVLPNTKTASESRHADNRMAGRSDPPRSADDAMTYDRINRHMGFVPANDAEVTLFVERIQTAAKVNDELALLACFSHEDCFARVVAGAELTPFQRSEMLRGFKVSNPFGQIALMIMLPSTDFQLVRMIRRGTELRPLFRLDSQQGGLAYNEFVIQAGGESGPRVVDMFAYASGEYLSLSLRPIALGPFLSDVSPERIPSKGIDSAIVASADSLTEISMSLSQGNPSKALAAFDRLQPPLNDQTRMIAIKSLVARIVGPIAYRDAVQGWSTLHPNDIATDLLLMELYRTEKTPVEQFLVADRLLKTMQDPYLHYYRVAGLIDQDRLPEASEAIAASKAVAPNRCEIYVAEIGLLMRLKNHQQTATAIEQLELKFGDEALQLASFPEFNEFSDSDAGHKFLARRAGFDF
jgi:hypothetical protein